MNQVVKLMHH